MADLPKSATAPPQPDADDAMRKDAMRKSGAGACTSPGLYTNLMCNVVQPVGLPAAVLARSSTCNATRRLTPEQSRLAEYFDRVLAKAQAGKDPFREPPKARRRSTDAEAIDPDLETVGRVLEGSKLYVISALFIISSSCSLILAKVHRHCVISRKQNCHIQSHGPLLSRQLTARYQL